MRKKGEYNRRCKYCDKMYNTTARCGKVCNECAEKNRKNFKCNSPKGGSYNEFMNRFMALGVPKKELLLIKVYKRRIKRGSVRR